MCVHLLDQTFSSIKSLYTEVLHILAPSSRRERREERGCMRDLARFREVLRLTLGHYLASDPERVRPGDVHTYRIPYEALLRSLTVRIRELVLISAILHDFG